MALELLQTFPACLNSVTNSFHVSICVVPIGAIALYQAIEPNAEDTKGKKTRNIMTISLNYL